MTRTTKSEDTDSMFANGGGNATAAGVHFQSAVAASLAGKIITEDPLDGRLALGAARPVSLRFETEAPVDDILVATDHSGWLFFQAKNRLTNSSAMASELGKTIDEFVRLWKLTTNGTGDKDWNRPLVAGRDAMVIAVGPATSATIRTHMARALDALRSGAVATLSDDQSKALNSIRDLTSRMLKAWGGDLAGVKPDDILKFVHVIDFDFGGPHRDASVAILGHALQDQLQASAGFSILERECTRLMSIRGGANAAALRTCLERGGIAVKAAPDFADDVQILRERTDRVAKDLADYQKTSVASVEANINRACTQVVIDAARDRSIVLVGDPGAGKSAVINDAALRLKAQGNEVVLLAVDRLQVESMEGLSTELGISNTFQQVLTNWPGTGPAYLFLDALDACRFGKSEALFRTIMNDVLDMEGGRWRVVASIRTFDLIVGYEFARLFKGIPPNPDFVDSRFQGVSHVHIPEWSEEEFTELLSRIPKLNTAISKGDSRLRELAHVPFNTRLLADLLSDGAEPEAFASLSSQVQLLDMYWNRRIRPLGAPAEQCLRNTVLAMIGQGRMDASRLAAGKNTSTAVDDLLRLGVLILASNDRSVAFRHHILFDYVASRVLIDLNDITGLEGLLKQGGAGLLLAPALNFALTELWESTEQGRQQFWHVTAHLIGNRDSDPIARSVSARAASNLPMTRADIAGLVPLMTGSDADNAIDAFRHIVGSLSVRIEDEVSAPPAPWCALAASLVPIIEKVAWPLRQLIGNFVDNVSDPVLRAELGAASRALLSYAFDAEGGQYLMPLAIGYVGKTFETDPVNSRRLFERLISPERMREYAVTEMLWIAEQVENVAFSDPKLATAIYRRAFEHQVTDDGETHMGQSQILPLRSNRRQDYKHSQWRLKQAFPKILSSHPLEAADIAVEVARAHIANEHTTSADRQPTEFYIGDTQHQLFDDYSHIWASEEEPYASEDEQHIVCSLVNYLRSCPENDALAIVERLLVQNIPAWIWARLFMISAERGGALSERLWPIAAQTAFLSSSDTIKDALDLIAKGYPERNENERQDFERAVLEITVPKSSDPEGSRRYIQQRVFGFLGTEALITNEARTIAQAARASGRNIENERPFQLTEADWIERDGEFNWLRSQGVNLEASENASTLDCIARLNAEKTGEEVRISQRLSLLSELANTLHECTADYRVVSYSWGQLATDLVVLTQESAAVKALSGDEKAEIIDLIDKVVAAANAGCRDQADSDAYGSVLESTAEAALNLSRADEDTANRLDAVVAALAVDPSRRVRAAVSTRIGCLWETDRVRLWSLADYFAEHEKDPCVLVGLVNFLIRAIHSAPDKVEEIAQRLIARTNIVEGDLHKTLSEGFGSLTFVLWVRHGLAGSRGTISHWLSNRTQHRTELLHGVYALQSALVLGYNNGNDVDIKTRHRSQSLAFEIIDASAKGLEEYIALDSTQRTDEQEAAVQVDAEVLDRMSDQFLFAVGAPEIRQEGEPKALKEVAERRQFLSENEAAFRRVGDVGTPHTIYYLLQLLEFLMPGNPALVFDLVTHSLLNAGRIHGYQGESLGADQLVRMIGRFVADHRELCEEPHRRSVLVSVLEIFVDAGWPSARRLLYRLPEALR